MNIARFAELNTIAKEIEQWWQAVPADKRPSTCLWCKSLPRIGAMTSIFHETMCQRCLGHMEGGEVIKFREARFNG